ncbi:MAG: hypothetical protein QOJ98_1591 [Acidobacteriota bacterium]|nr:hypothetical protein [Acidobacteriota bacterium]
MAAQFNGILLVEDRQSCLSGSRAESDSCVEPPGRLPRGPAVARADRQDCLSSTTSRGRYSTRTGLLNSEVVSNAYSPP